MIIFVTEPNEIAKRALELLEAAGHTVVTEPTPEADVLFVRTYTQVTREYLLQFPKVRFVLRAGVGLDSIDVAYCKEKGIEVINAPGANANAVAEYVVGVALNALRHFVSQATQIKKLAWRSHEFLGQELRGKVLGLVGCGHVGKLIAHKLGSWELAEIIGYDPFFTAEQLQAAGVRKVELSEVVKSADILSLHVPLTAETKHLIDQEALGQMKKGALLINAARGGVVDELALVGALKSGQLSGAVLDVFETEPAVRPELLALENVILTPHIAGYTHEADTEIALAPARELLHRSGTIARSVVP